MTLFLVEEPANIFYKINCLEKVLLQDVSILSCFLIAQNFWLKSHFQELTALVIFVIQKTLFCFLTSFFSVVCQFLACINFSIFFSEY